MLMARNTSFKCTKEMSVLHHHSDTDPVVVHAAFSVVVVEITFMFTILFLMSCS
jgi:hypothetical protein